METYMHKGKHGKCKLCGKMHAGKKCPLDIYQKHEAHEGKFIVKKDYNFGIYKMDPSVNVLTKFKK